MKQSLDTAYLLQQYGIWLRVQAGMPRYVSPQWALMKDNIQVSSEPTPDILEEVAMLIDRYICRLHMRYPKAAEALWNYYRYAGMTYRQLGRLMGIHHNKAEELVSVGFWWLDSSLDSYADAA
ncbi:hypothetical protein I5I61_18825 [Pseudomonas nitroreducens]|uniref:Antitermination protein Q n=1 Tax=Pseudomonas nitroreducens TaxID=46680 RepID=A0ABS0KN37_PSENT|nr:hypothetical protein [Pseudomonas nitroreducens]MBG6289513.1 hypothetical protein [Pseudomonas nitroreducens]